MLNFKFCGDGCPFFAKNNAQKNPLKNKKKCHFAKNSLKVAQNQEQASEQASQVNQASQAISKKNQAKLVSLSKMGNRN